MLVLLLKERSSRSYFAAGSSLRDTTPGSGKSLGIADLTHQSTSCKDTKGATHLPLLAIRAPKNGGTDLALGTAFCTIFGIVPAMPWYVRRAWLVQAMAEAGVECLIIDDAQDLNLAHLAFLKELTDNLAAPPYERIVSLCLVTAHSGKVIPLKEIFSRPDILWRQFRRRLDTERPFCVVAGHTEEEVRSILEAFETLGSGINEKDMVDCEGQFQMNKRSLQW